MKDILDSHTHTIASGHAYSTLHEMARAAADKGLELLGITEHAMAMPGTCHEYYFMNMRSLPRTMYASKSATELKSTSWTRTAGSTWTNIC